MFIFQGCPMAAVQLCMTDKQKYLFSCAIILSKRFFLIYLFFFYFQCLAA